MTDEEITGRINELISEKNYIGAYLLLKDTEIEQAAKYDLTGRIVTDIIDDLTSEKNREKIAYLRSILVWIFRDVPGLSSVYREQLRLSSGGGTPVADFLKGIRTFGDLNDKFDTIKDRVEEAADSPEVNDFQDKLKDFFSQAGVEVEQGLKRATEFFDNLNKTDAAPHDVEREEDIKPEETDSEE
jgi:hypothetical protein